VGTSKEVPEGARPDAKLLVEYAAELPLEPHEYEEPSEDMVIEWEVLSVSMGICVTHHGSAS
jgi:hypothetical protein